METYPDFETFKSDFNSLILDEIIDSDTYQAVSDLLDFAEASYAVADASRKPTLPPIIIHTRPEPPQQLG
jgi:seryl-tRNA synthetase